MIFKSLQCLINSTPLLVSPFPVSGECGKAKGTPSPKIVGRDHTGPIERRPDR